MKIRKWPWIFYIWFKHKIYWKCIKKIIKYIKLNISKYFILFLFLYNRWFPIGNWAWVWPKLLVIHTYPTYATSMGWLWGPLLFCSSERGKEPRRFCVPQIGGGGPILCEIDAKMPSPLAHQARAHRVPAGLSGKSPANVLVAQKSVGPAFMLEFNSKHVRILINWEQSIIY